MVALTATQREELEAELRSRFAPEYVPVGEEQVPVGPRIEMAPEGEIIILMDWDTPPADPELAKDPRKWGGQKVVCSLDTYVDMWGDILYPEYCGGVV